MAVRASRIMFIGDVRGRGLMVGVELLTDRNEKSHAKAETAVLFEKLRVLGVLVGKGGLHGNVFRNQDKTTTVFHVSPKMMQVLVISFTVQ
ncbi:hypothetical protein M0R45_011522 [Rubus argutus]|uniref:Uncharacterized protein n=1 Tax=Rubus argutus TaxID=59490 RepID=A0AAW1YAN3_RUBAR